MNQAAGGPYMRHLKQAAPDQADRVEIRWLFLTIWRAKWLILASIVVFTLLASLMMKQVTPRYTAQGSVMLDPREQQILTTQDVVSERSLTNPVIETEMAVLRSNLLLESVIESLGPEALERFDPVNAQPTALERGIGRAVAAAISVFRSATVPETAAPAAPLLSPEEARMRRLVGALRQGLTVRRDAQSYVISVAVETSDPALSALFTNEILRQYIGTRIEERVETARQATAWLERRVLAMRAEVQQAESAVERFKADRLEMDGISLEAISQQLVELNMRLATARADRAIAEARLDQMAQLVATEGPAAAASTLDLPIVLQLREELLDLNRRDLALAVQNAPDHPARQSIAAAAARLESDIVAEVRNAVEAARGEATASGIREASLRESLAELETRIAAISAASLDLRRLERDATAIRGAYESTLSRLNETRSIEQLQRSDAKIVERAVIPGAPSAPRVKLFTAMGGAIGFAVALALVIATELLRTGYGHAAQVEADTGVPVISTIPRGPWRSAEAMVRYLARDPHGLFAERIRQLRTTLLLTRGDSAPFSLLVLSSLPGEGKTTLVLSLARMFERAGKSVILVDCDTRQSKLSRTLDLPRGAGLAEVMNDLSTPAEAISRSEALGVDVMPAVDGGLELVDNLSVGRLSTLLEDLKRRYDVVIVDAAPLLMVSDGILLSQVADSLLYLVRQTATPARAVRAGLSILEDVGKRPAGIVLTMADPRNETASGGMPYL